ncbi:MAG: hypothetical protein OHK0023_01760 [Anaerolineae bacterium]
MAQVGGNPEQLTSIAQALRSHSSRILAALDGAAAEMGRLTPDVFAGGAAEAARSRFSHIRGRMSDYAAMLLKFADQLDQAAAAFRRVDQEHGTPSAASGTPSNGFSSARIHAAQMAMKGVTWQKLW